MYGKFLGVYKDFTKALDTAARPRLVTYLSGHFAIGDGCTL